MSDTTTLHCYIQREQLRLQAFKDWYLLQHCANPSNYPLELPDDEWESTFDWCSPVAMGYKDHHEN